MEHLDSIGGELVGGAHRVARAYTGGRVCEHPGCSTRLSIYNSRPCCALHDFDESLLHFRSPRHDHEVGAVVELPVRGDRLAPAARGAEPKGTRRASGSHAA